jgi:peptidoglycan pentaglycine glycine transferase (the first glycine)
VQAILNPGFDGAQMETAAPKLSISTDLLDPAWDRFLEIAPTGQFQQSSLWAVTKKADGWRPLRAVFRSDDQVVGGFQILTQKKKIGTIGYISKGPVLLEETPDRCAEILETMFRVVQENRIVALIIQPPDDSRVLPSLLEKLPFMENSLMRVNESTLCVDVSQGFPAVQQNMRRSTRRLTRQALKMGVTIREGNETDLPLFFDLMLETCRRQGATPNPSSLEALRSLWSAFAPTKRIRLTFAEFEGKSVSGLLCIPFGRAMNIWKKGWNATATACHPNELLNADALEWASQHGLQFADFAALDRSIALSLTNGQEISAEQMGKRDFFNMGFGGFPKLLPPARVYIQNPLFRRLYSSVISNPATQRLLHAFAK